MQYAAARRSKGYIVPGVPYWEHTVRGNTYTVPAPGSQLRRPMTIVTGCGAITSNTINASRLYSLCTAYASTSTTEVRTRTSLSAGSYLTEQMFYHMFYYKFQYWYTCTRIYLYSCMYCTSTGYQYICEIGVWSCPCVTAHPFVVRTLHNYIFLKSSRSGLSSAA